MIQIQMLSSTSGFFLSFDITYRGGIGDKSLDQSSKLRSGIEPYPEGLLVPLATDEDALACFDSRGRGKSWGRRSVRREVGRIVCTSLFVPK